MKLDKVFCCMFFFFFFFRFLGSDRAQNSCLLRFEELSYRNVLVTCSCMVYERKQNMT